MAITIKADDRVSDAVPDEEVYLPGALPGDDNEGPFPFVYPRIGKLLSIQRRLRGLDLSNAAVEELDGMRQWLAAGLGPDAWAHILARVEEKDEVDLLDEEHLLKLFQLLNQNATGRPITSSNGASRRPWESSSTAAPSPQESVSAN